MLLLMTYTTTEGKSFFLHLYEIELEVVSMPHRQQSIVLDNNKRKLKM